MKLHHKLEITFDLDEIDTINAALGTAIDCTGSAALKKSAQALKVEIEAAIFNYHERK